MKASGIRHRMSRCFERGRPPSPSPVDFEICALGGGDTNTMLFQKLPAKETATPPEKRIKELNEEIRRLDLDLIYYKNLTEAILLKIMPTLHYHSQALYFTIQKHNTSIEQALWEQQKSGMVL
ncbi:hypothetical protein HJFPF1_13626 [Paramyrothecium foliicola]|nr:hypothetical protein HJFPF1_13626 [Paramyrothecium foliicola]